MAGVTTLEGVSVSGNRQVRHYKVTFSGDTSRLVETGLNDVKHVNVTEKTTEGQCIVYKNYSDAGSTVKIGAFFIDGATDGDTLSVEVFGS